MRRPWLLAAVFAAAAVAVAAVALLRDNSSAEANPAGFPNNPPGRKPLIFDVGLVAGVNVSSSLQQAHALGADAIRVLVPWNLVAPTNRPKGFQPSNPEDHSYNFDSFDKALREIDQLGMEVVLSPTGPAPPWAAKPGSAGLADPDPGPFG